MEKLLIATKNPAKFAEISRFLKGLPLELVSFEDLGISGFFEETGKTFTANAKAKAVFFAQKSGLPTLADDGGIEIKALGGEPGIKSRRWVDGKTEATDEELINYTLKKLAGLPPAKRQAQFRAVLALAIPGGGVYTAEGVVKGVIAKRPHLKRMAGYPYRSIFYLPQIKKYYLEDELTEEETQKYNHRAKALKKFRKIINTLTLREC